MSHPELEIHKTASLLANSSLRDEVVDAGRGRGRGQWQGRTESMLGRGWEWQVPEKAKSPWWCRMVARGDQPLTLLSLMCLSLILSFSDLQDPVECLAGHPDGSPFSSSNSIPVVPQATILSQVSSAFSFREPLNHPPLTQSPPTQVIHLPSPQPSAPLASSSAMDTPPSSGTISSPTPQTDLSQTLPPVKSSLSSPTASAPVDVITATSPPDKTGQYDGARLLLFVTIWLPQMQELACLVKIPVIRPG